MDLELTDRVVLITGGSKGIGLACARVFSREGAKVAIASRDPANLENATASLSSDGIEVAPVRVDLADSEDAERMARQVETTLGTIDVLINSAGAARRSLPHEMTPADWHAGMAAKYFTYIHAIEAVIDGMIAAGSGAIVNVIGAGGKIASPTHLAGGSANAALMLATAGLAKAYAGDGIRVNGVNPGFTLTDRMEQSIEATARQEGITPEQARQRLDERAPMGRVARSEEVADVVAFLASSRASYVSGAIVMVDGASTASVV